MGFIAQGQADSLTIGGRVFTDLDNLVILHGLTTANGFATCRRGADSAGYQIPTGKKLKIFAATFNSRTAASASPAFGYGNTDVGSNSAAAPTTPVYNAGDFGQVAAAAAGNVVSYNYFFEVPAGKYVFFAGAQLSTTLFGYLEDA